MERQEIISELNELIHDSPVRYPAEAMKGLKDAIAYIESHPEPVKPEPMKLKYSETKEEYWFYESICPKCENRWISMGIDHFCPVCGQPVIEHCEADMEGITICGN